MPREGSAPAIGLCQRSPTQHGASDGEAREPHLLTMLKCAAPCGLARSAFVEGSFLLVMVADTRQVMDDAPAHSARVETA